MNQVAADLVAGSLQHAATGRFPTRGFRGEVFQKGTYREKLAGKEFGNGYKMLDPYLQLRFSLLLKLSWKTTLVHCNWNKHLLQKVGILHLQSRFESEKRKPPVPP